MEPLGIDPRGGPTATYLRPTAGYLGTQSQAMPFGLVKQDREAHHGRTHFQAILFQITQRIVDELLAPTLAATDRKSRVLRLQARHQLFPQVFAFVLAFANRRVNFNGVDRRELGLEKYVLLTVGRLRDAIVPDDSAGEPPLLPTLNRYRPCGSTAGVDFPTTRPVATAKSQINKLRGPALGLRGPGGRGPWTPPSPGRRSRPR
jgi:type III restriction enzyme